MIILLNFNGNWLHHGALSELSHFGKAFYREIESGNHYNAGQNQIKNHSYAESGGGDGAAYHSARPFRTGQKTGVSVCGISRYRKI